MRMEKNTNQFTVEKYADIKWKTHINDIVLVYWNPHKVDQQIILSLKENKASH